MGACIETAASCLIVGSGCIVPEQVTFRAGTSTSRSHMNARDWGTTQQPIAPRQQAHMIEQSFGSWLYLLYDSVATMLIARWGMASCLGLIASLAATADPGDQDIRKILPGQKVTGVVVYGDGAPLTPALDETSDPPVHDTTWTISDCSPFLDYVVASGSATGTLTTYAPQKGATGWAFWAKPGTGTVACEHKMKLTEGPGTVIPVSLAKTVPVADLDSIDVSGEATSVGPKCFIDATHRWLQFSKMWFQGSMRTPEMFWVGQDKGSWEFVQLVLSTERHYWVSGVKTTLPPEFSSPPRLDNSVPYPQSSSVAANGTPQETFDTPGFGVDKNLAGLQKLYMKDSFRMYWMYLPPCVQGSEVRYVPIASCDWNIGLSAASPLWIAEGELSLDGTPPAIVASIVEAVQLWSKPHPVWTQVVVNQ